MDTYYTLLDIDPQATPEEIALAYQRQRERYSVERVAGLDVEFKRIASERTTALERAFAVLSDPARRQSYDHSLQPAALPGGGPAVRSGVSRRELMMLGGGALVGVVIIALVWLLVGRTAQPGLPPVAQVNRPAPDFTLATVDGQPVKLSDYRGKVVLVNFWYTGCAPCQEETPALQSVYQKLAERGFVILGVNVRGNERQGSLGDDDIRRFVQKYSVSYPIVLDTKGEVGRSYQVLPLPTTIFIDQTGNERFRSFSAVTADEVERIFTELQREASARR